MCRERVSTHAPAWGASRLSIHGFSRQMSFNPRARMGRDSHKHIQHEQKYSFNPRARMGRDRVMPSIKAFRIVSTHAPAWGATVYCTINHCLTNVSTHAPAWGATHGEEVSQRSEQFQPTRPHGARRTYTIVRYTKLTVSTHAPAWGATSTSFIYRSKQRFQPTRPHGARR